MPRGSAPSRSCWSSATARPGSNSGTSTISGYTLKRWFAPGPDAPPGAEERARYASRLNVGPLIENLIRWIEGRDGLDEETRLRWWGRIQREFHLGTREAFRLGSMPDTYRLPG